MLLSELASLGCRCRPPCQQAHEYHPLLPNCEPHSIGGVCCLHLILLPRRSSNQLCCKRRLRQQPAPNTIHRRRQSLKTQLCALVFACYPGLSDMDVSWSYRRVQLTLPVDRAEIWGSARSLASTWSTGLPRAHRSADRHRTTIHTTCCYLSTEVSPSLFPNHGQIQRSFVQNAQRRNRSFGCLHEMLGPRLSACHPSPPFLPLLHRFRCKCCYCYNHLHPANRRTERIAKLGTPRHCLNHPQAAASDRQTQPRVSLSCYQLR